MKTVLITGAYRGLGFETARQMSERGWQVIIGARRQVQGLSAAAKLKHASFLEIDITDGSSVALAAKAVTELNVLINNAAIISEGDQDILTLPPEICDHPGASRTGSGPAERGPRGYPAGLCRQGCIKLHSERTAARGGDGLVPGEWGAHERGQTVPAPEKRA